MSESPKRPGLRRRAAQGSFYAQYFAEGELSQDEDEDEEAPADAAPADDTPADDEAPASPPRERLTRSGRRSKIYVEPDWDEDEDAEDDDDHRSARPTRRSQRTSRSLRDFVAPDDEEEVDENADYAETVRARRAQQRQQRRENLLSLAASRSARRREARVQDEASPPHMRTSARLAARRASSADPHTSDETPSSASEAERGTAGRAYSFRTRKKINYSQLAPPPEPLRDGFGRRVRRTTRTSRADDLGGASSSVSHGAARALPSLPLSALPRAVRGRTGPDAWPLTMSGKDYAAAFGDEVDDSSDDEPRHTLNAARLGGGGGSALLENGPAPAPGGHSSATDPMGRMRRDGDPLADVDPLGVDMQIDFTHVGGLESHVQQLKEMVSLPLLYPELFQQFGVSPPRGVLFHGPPGTGKTLIARALAASCSTTGQSISFFMRKGADCLSKWVGEAERQLRLLFEEAKNAQPSIIFFDEIDGLAPVRSSKQDQIHASIVSTLLALMDGMEGRGQVVVIGATNRPDSIDPALRRPGRFDREFYFPLPSKAARQSILAIHTRKWSPPLDPQLQEMLAEATNGFGGADLRALCTEATLNAIQRHYPQIYGTSDRLELDPASVQVGARDFVLALEKLVPSSARAAHAAAAPLPAHLVPLVGSAVDDAYAVCRRMLPPRDARSALEEAQWEPDPAYTHRWPAPLSSDTPAGALERELLQQSFERTRVYRPRLLVHGEPGMGQAAVAAALLHRLEGYAVQTLSLPTLLGSATETPEAALVQHFHEARRLKPSVVLVPEIDRWATLLPDTTRAAFGALLDTLAPNDPVLLVGVSSVPFFELAPEVRGWFGIVPATRVAVSAPAADAREAFVADIVRQAARPPSEFADALPKRRRTLPALPKAPPKPPRQPTQAELNQQLENDARVLEHLKFRLGPVLAELRKKFKKFTRDVWEEYNLRDLMEQFDWRREKGKVVITLRYDRHERAESDARLSSDDERASDGPKPRDASPPLAAQDEAEAEDAEDLHEVAHAAPAAHEEPVDPGVTDADAEGETAAAPAAPEPPLSPGALGGPPRPPPAPDAQADDDSPYIYRDFTIYTMSLDKMQKRLYYNGYLTCDAFMDDIQKMVSNAEEAREVDADRVFRARQMQNLAAILLDQYIDASFRAECERMAQRVLAREEAAKREAERQKAAEVHPRRPNGLRYSARQQGEAIEPHDLVDVATIERAHKRARSASAPVPHAESGQEASSEPPPADEPDAVKRVRLADGEAHASPTDAAPTSPPRPPAPVLPLDAQHALTAALVRTTDGFNVEQLQQLRAVCFDAILAHRAEWDRTALVAELPALAEDLARAVRQVE
ncbi:TAT-binding protein-like protein 7, AAA ATPase [Malassezia brasiliensis]|uniref:TAT-binding protein-like protein 7, AAA ATPase n=1 Tax=Malassezia brasiliensis TaxID=1821822 RepID=A0AAF0IQN6_9BASI|nr:TAT-binding protein-like protein 7, AAA ATPase [Malassezia brasiliensis]